MTHSASHEPRPVEEYKVSSTEVAPAADLTADEGWIDMEVRWLLTKDSVGAEKTVVGRTVLVPGAKHDIHRHLHAEEWEFVISGHAIKHIGEESVELAPGDIVFVPQGVDHGLENASDTEPVVTLWGYSGASTLEESGYEFVRSAG